MIQLVATAGWLRGMSRRRYRDVGAVWSLMEEGVRLCNSYHLWIRDPDPKTGFWPLARQRALEARLQDAALAKRIAEETYLSLLDVETACDPSHSNPVWEEREPGLRTEIQTLGDLCRDPRRGGRADLTRVRAFPRGTVADLVGTVRSRLSRARRALAGFIDFGGTESGPSALVR